MYLASGVPRVPDMLRRGIAVALASDGPGSNNRQDMFEVLKQTILLQKVHLLDATVLQPEDAIRMACRGGAHAAGLAGEIGAVEPGRKADLLVVSLASPFVAPVHRVPSALVYCCTPRDLRHVVVDGRTLVRDGEVVGIDVPGLLRDAADAAASVFRRAGVASRLLRPSAG
jgi:5-methylthioadenosine/S-adenosylhomocysteine deaminase